MPTTMTFEPKVSQPGHMKLARLLAEPEQDFEDRVRQTESDPLFILLKEAGAVTIDPFSGCRFVARRSVGRQPLSPEAVLPDLHDGEGDVVWQIQQLGQERFEECFLRDENSSDDQRAQTCGIDSAAAHKIREFVDRAYIQAECAEPSSQRLPPKSTSAVAEIELEEGRPVLGFFNWEIWKGRYHIDLDKCRDMRSSLPRREARRLEAFLHRLELLDQRKTTLYAMLEALLETQMVFFVDGDPDHRSVLTRQAMASRLHVSPVMLDWLISNKSIELPWGVEAPLEAFVPAEKSLLRDRLHGLAMAHPDFSDEDLSDEMELQFGVKIPSRSIAEYRKEINIKTPSAAVTQQSFSRSRFDDIWAEGLQVEN